MYNFTLNIKIFLIGLFFRKRTKKNCHHVLVENDFQYYNCLNNKRKNQFIIRVLFFLNNIDFSLTENFNLNPEKKIQIASAFAQISFGLKFFSLNFFKEICIVSRSYSYKHMDGLFDGDVNLATKRINMSWPAIEQGFNVADDALNLCIHELAHAMYFENLKRSVNDKFFSKEELKEWKELALKKIEKIDLDQNVVLRDYAGSNLMEFFAVSLETFFERPEHFKVNEPVLFAFMVNMFNQNPLNKTDPISL